MHAALSGLGGGANLWGGGGPSSQISEVDKRLCDGCRDNEYEKVKAALAAGASPTVQFRLALGEITPILLCASRGYVPIAKLLIAQEPKVIHERMAFDGTTCLHHAASNEQADMCELLLTEGCGVNKQDKLGRTALMDAAEVGAVKVMEVLVEHHANVTIIDKEQHTAISYCLDFIGDKENAVSSSDDESGGGDRFLLAALCLIQHGADPNYAGKFTGRTLLHYLAAQGDLEKVKMLIQDHRAETQPVDQDGKTPLDYAKDREHQDVVDYLEFAIPDSGACQCTLL